MQHSHCEKVVQTLKKKWFPAVLEIFRRDAEKSDSEEVGAALLSAVSTLMFNQLRGLLANSIEAFVDFFDRYRTCRPRRRRHSSRRRCASQP